MQFTGRRTERDNKILLNELLVFQYFCAVYCNDKAIFVGFSLIWPKSLGFFLKTFLSKPLQIRNVNYKMKILKENNKIKI